MAFCDNACSHSVCYGLDTNGDPTSTASELCLNEEGSCWGVRHAIDGNCVVVACDSADLTVCARQSAAVPAPAVRS